MTKRSTLLSPIVEKAIRFSARSHREQRRKGSDLPYIVHPAAVASILQQAGFDDDHLLAAAWLHDTVEDTSATLEEIAREFPAEVAELVDAMSEDKTDADGNKLSWQHRKKHHLEAMCTASVRVKAVMLADKLHNMISMSLDAESDSNMWSRFNSPREALLLYYRSMIGTANGISELDELRAQCESQLEKLEAISD